MTASNRKSKTSTRNLNQELIGPCPPPKENLDCLNEFVETWTLDHDFRFLVVPFVQAAIFNSPAVYCRQLGVAFRDINR